ncbi:MAG TPA: FAD-binding oxidoreductase [Anaerolineales bacterium]
MSRRSQIVICGAGIAGVSTAYHLARTGFKDILIVDPLPPLSLTSDRSTECYRNWWPDPELLALMNRSIDLMEQLVRESANLFRMNHRGYLYLISREAEIASFRQRAARIASLGAGELRVHSSVRSGYRRGSSEAIGGADLLLGSDLVQAHYPYVTERAVAALHVRRAGWLSAQQLGMYLLDCARQQGVLVERAEVDGLDVHSGRVRAVHLDTAQRIECDFFINAAGPYAAKVASLLDLNVPLDTELHLKVAFSDYLGVVDRAAPLLVWDEPQSLPWEPEELDSLRADADARWLTEELPAGAHVRPEGSSESSTVLMLWDYKPRHMQPAFPPPSDDLYPEIVLRGLSTMLPGLKQYLGRSPRPHLDGGYYVKTPENRLFAGPLPVEGAYMIAGLSGYGIMSACAAGELLAAHVAGSPLPAYALAFSPSRYDDVQYRTGLGNLDKGGEL